MVDKNAIRQALTESWDSKMYETVSDEFSAQIKVDGLKYDARLITNWTMVLVAEAHFRSYEPVASEAVIDHATELLFEGYLKHVENESIDVDGIDIDALLKQFNDEYEFIYDTEVGGHEVAGYGDAMEYGDWLIKHRKKLVNAFARRRGDMLSSDREVAAFGFAVNSLAA